MEFTPEQELEIQSRIDKAVKDAEEKLTSKHNGIMASKRVEHDNELKKAKEDAEVIAKDSAKKEFEEKTKELNDELSTLRSFKKDRELSDLLAKENLPVSLKHDSRLIGAKDEKETAEVIKTLKTEFSQYQPKGAKTTTNVQHNGGDNSGESSNVPKVVERKSWNRHF